MRRSVPVGEKAVRQTASRLWDEAQAERLRHSLNPVLHTRFFQCGIEMNTFPKEEQTAD
jgi:hypothetical protein